MYLYITSLCNTTGTIVSITVSTMLLVRVNNMYQSELAAIQLLTWFR